MSDEIIPAELDVDDIPWETAPEMAADIADELGCSDGVREHAVQIATDHGLNGDLGSTPRPIAASAVYLAALLQNEKVTQPEVCEASGVSDMAIRQNYQLLGEREGLDMGNDDGDDTADDESITVEPEPPSSPFSIANQDKKQESLQNGDEIPPWVLSLDLIWSNYFRIPVTVGVIVGAGFLLESVIDFPQMGDEFAAASEEIVATAEPAITPVMALVFVVIMSVWYSATSDYDSEEVSQ